MPLRAPSGPGNYTQPGILCLAYWDETAADYKMVTSAQPLPTSFGGSGSTAANPLYSMNVLYDAQGAVNCVQASGGRSAVVSGVRTAVGSALSFMSTGEDNATLPPLYGCVVPVAGTEVRRSDDTSIGAAPIVATPQVGNNYVVKGLSPQAVTVIDGNGWGGVTVGERSSIQTFDNVMGTANHAMTATNPQAVPTGGNLPALQLEQQAHINTADPGLGYAKVVQLAQATNAGQYMPTAAGSGDKTWMVRTNAAPDGVSQELMVGSLTGVKALADDGKALASTDLTDQKADGNYVKTLGYNTDGLLISPGMNVNQVGSFATTAALATTIIGTAASVVQDVRLVDAAGDAVGVTNGAVHNVLINTNTGNPLTVKLSGTDSKTESLSVGVAAADESEFVSVERVLEEKPVEQLVRKTVGGMIELTNVWAQNLKEAKDDAVKARLVHKIADAAVMMAALKGKTAWKEVVKLPFFKENQAMFDRLEKLYISAYA